VYNDVLHELKTMGYLYVVTSHYNENDGMCTYKRGCKLYLY